MALIPDVDFEEDGDDSEGGFITFSTNDGEFEIVEYKAVDSDDASKRIILRVGGVVVGEATTFGDGSVITVETDDHATTEAEFEFLGSGGIDDIKVCRFDEKIELVKEVSVDGGVTYFDANDSASSPVTSVGGTVLYRFTVTNTGMSDLENVVVATQRWGSRTSWSVILRPVRQSC